MKRYLISLVTLLTFSGLLSLAQTTHALIPDNFKPSALNQPGQAFPQVNSQGYVRFRVVAPKAQSVNVSLGLGGRGGTTLTKDTAGTWTGTTVGPMIKGFIITILQLMEVYLTIRAH